MIEKRVVTGVIWIEDEPGYDAPQYVLTTDMLDRAQRSEESVENYLISLETLQTMAQTADDEITDAKTRHSSSATTTATTTIINTDAVAAAAACNDDSDKDISVPAWARRNTKFKKTKNLAAAGGGSGKRNK